MNRERILEIISRDIDSASFTNQGIIADIQKWLDAYDGKPYGNEVEGRSKLVWKLIKKQVNALIPNIVKPFIGTKTIVECDPRTANDYYKAKIDERCINHFFNYRFKKKKFLKSIAKQITKEGTCWIRVGWFRKTKKKEFIVKRLPSNIDDWIARGAKVEKLDDGFKIYKEEVIHNRPVAKVIRNEAIVIDPTADNVNEAKFIIYKYSTDISTLRQEPQFSEEDIRRLEEFISKTEEADTLDGEEIHPSNPYQFSFQDKERKKIKIYEYWGEIDIDGDGITEPIVAVVAEPSIIINDNGSQRSFSKKFLLKAKENPYPFKKPPFVCIRFDDEVFEVWGKALADIIDEEQKFYTAIVRGIMDNIAQANNGIKFVKKGALDSVNFKRLMNGERVVEVNSTAPLNQVTADGNFNELPASVYNILSLIEQQTESLTGVNKYMQGIVGVNDTKSTATQFSATMTQSQIRLLDIVDNVAEGLREMFMMWVEMMRKFLSDKEIEDITGFNLIELRTKETNKLIAEYGIDELPEDTKRKAMLLIMKEIDDIFDKADAKYDIDIKVGTDGLKQIKINAINMFLQQASPLIANGSISPEVTKHLIADFAELLDLEKTAKMIREYEPKPNPFEEENMKTELELKKAKAMKESALAQNALARTKNVATKTAKEIASTDADIANKYADVIAKIKDGKENGSREK